MRAAYPLLALVLGALGFAAIEVAGAAAGVRTALGPSLWLDALTYAIATLLLALAFAPAFRRARGLSVLGLVLGFLLLYAPLTAVLAGVLDLTVNGGWAHASEVRGAFIAKPVNLIVTFTLDLWYVALPAGVVSVLLLRGAARGARTAS